MSKLIPYLLFCSFFLSSWTRAQNTLPLSKPPPPTPPFVTPLPDETILTVKVTPAGSTGKSLIGTKMLKEFIVTKSGDLREVTSVWMDDSRTDTWFSRGYRLEKGPGNSDILITPTPPGTDREDADFFALDWLSLSNYVGVESNSGKDCYHFQTEVDYKDQHIKVDYSAYIEAKTKTPVSWDVSPYHFEIASLEARNASTPLALPADFQDALKARLEAAARAIPYKKINPSRRPQ